MKKIEKIKKKYLDSLSAQIDDIREIEAIFHRLLFHFHGLSRIDYIMDKNLEIEERDLLKALEQLKTGKPWQYIAGEVDFFDISLFVNENVLIPRPETEELVQWIIEEYKEKSPKNILDIGTGSGTIAISLAKNFPQAKVTAIDLSKKALEIAQKNAIRNKVTIEWIQTDVLKLNSLNYNYDIIVSNPPYVRMKEKKLMKKNVLDFEPETALFVPDQDPLLFYKKIIQLYINQEPKGKLYFEINEFLKSELENFLVEQSISNYTFKKDLYDKWRMLRITE